MYILEVNLKVKFKTNWQATVLTKELDLFHINLLCENFSPGLKIFFKHGNP